VGTVKTLRRLRNGDFLLEISSAVQSRIVNKLDNLAGCPVTASPHGTLNTCKGVIRCAPLVDQGRNYLRAETPRGFRHKEHLRQRRLLWQKKYKHLHRYLQSTNHSKTPSCWILESSCINIYIPNPPCCFKCQKFGHGKNACRGRETCATCGQVGHSNNNCTNEAKCPNCAGSHSAFSKSCPKWLFEKRVQEVKAEKGISFIEARKIASTESEGRSAPVGCTAAAVVGSRAAVSGSRSGPHCQLLVQLRYRLTSRGLRDRSNVLSSLLLHANTPASLHKLPPRNRSLTGYGPLFKHRIKNIHSQSFS